MKRTYWEIILLMVMATFAMPQSAFGQRAFVWQNGKITDLGTLGGTKSIATGINNLGQIVGYSSINSGQNHAFLWQNGKMTDLGTLGGEWSEAYSITFLSG